MHKNSNRVSATVNEVTRPASYTLDDQTEVYGDNTYTYDEDGNLIEKVTPQESTTYLYTTKVICQPHIILRIQRL